MEKSNWQQSELFLANSNLFYIYKKFWSCYINSDEPALHEKVNNNWLTLGFTLRAQHGLCDVSDIEGEGL